MHAKIVLTYAVFNKKNIDQYFNDEFLIISRRVTLPFKLRINRYLQVMGARDEITKIWLAESTKKARAAKMAFKKNNACINSFF